MKLTTAKNFDERLQRMENTLNLVYHGLTTATSKGEKGNKPKYLSQVLNASYQILLKIDITKLH